MDEVFICGPEAMITATEGALISAGVPQNRVYTERFTSGLDVAAKVQADSDARAAQANLGKPIRMTVLLDGKRHALTLSADESVLEAALNAGLDIPYSCKGGVCSTCRCKVTQGTVVMQKNFTLDAPDVAQGFALSCQAHATSTALEVSFDER
jgi:ring-1,2-phenylacetyl-CoA epoxidase subunit PaaE